MTTHVVLGGPFMLTQLIWGKMMNLLQHRVVQRDHLWGGGLLLACTSCVPDYRIQSNVPEYNQYTNTGCGTSINLVRVVWVYIGPYFGHNSRKDYQNSGCGRSK